MVVVNVVCIEIFVIGSVALIVVVPVTVSAVAVPELSIVATALFEELQVADFVGVKSRVVLSSKVPVAVNCVEVVREITGSRGVIAIDLSGVLIMVSRVSPFIGLRGAVAESVVVPVTEPAVTRPLPIKPVVVMIEATSKTEEVQSANNVISCVEPSGKYAVA